MKRLIVLLACLSAFLPYFMVRADVMPGDTLKVAYKLHGQTRRFKFVYMQSPGGGLDLHWSIVRNLKLWQGCYSMSGDAVMNATGQSFLMPEDGNMVKLDDGETFGMISVAAFDQLATKGEFHYNGVTYKRSGYAESGLGRLIEVRDAMEGGRMWILENRKLPLIVKMEDNPLEINWEMTK